MVPTDVAPPVDASTRKVFVTGSGRCGECHEKMFDEWETSAHAQSVSSELYKASVAAAKDATCERCHAPLASEVPRDAVVTEGVTCDVCHTLRDPKPSVDGGTWHLAIEDMVKFGPRCDLKDHYFHRMGCSPEHKTAEICGTCHWWEPKGLPVFTEYADWKAGPKHDQPCQDCHMPKDRAALATGSPVRTGVPHHGLLGKAKELRKTSLKMDAKLDKNRVLTVTLHNVHAAHYVPSGLPERRIVVHASIPTDDSGEKWLDERELGRVLVDDNNKEVPFWAATRVGSDTRIAPGGQATMTFNVPPDIKGSVRVRVEYRGLSKAVAQQLGVNAEVQVLIDRSVQ
ncbi:MAG TPA: multiheme c-type cytochrome [Kofleriaceae bacterium]|nr:multiheme c-type cytochrome [Kofleriaceae bacterium]